MYPIVWYEQQVQQCELSVIQNVSFKSSVATFFWAAPGPAPQHCLGLKICTVLVYVFPNFRRNYSVVYFTVLICVKIITSGPVQQGRVYLNFHPSAANCQSNVYCMLFPKNVYCFNNRRKVQLSCCTVVSENVRCTVMCLRCMYR